MNDSLPKEVRQLCGVIIKNSLAGDTSEAKWLMIQQQKRTTIKENVLTCLGSETKEIIIDKDYVSRKLGVEKKTKDLKKYIL